MQEYIPYNFEMVWYVLTHHPATSATGAKVDCSGKRPWVLRKFEDFETYFFIK
jgi:hypothetical protein